MVKITPLLLLSCFRMDTAKATGAASAVEGKSISSLDWKSVCSAAGGSYQGHSWSMSSSGGKSHTKMDVTCSGSKISITCDGYPNLSNCADNGGGGGGGGAAPAPPPPPPPPEAHPAPGDYDKEATPGSCGGGLTKDEIQEMLDMHNKMRCAVGTPPITWDGDLECQAQKTQNQIGKMSHSSSYNLPIKSGENLASGTDVDQAAYMWFSEYTQSKNRGHYTAMVWKATKKVGCGIQKGGGGVVRCQYADGPPNFGGKSDYDENVPDFKGEKDKLAKCGIDITTLSKLVKRYKGWGIISPEPSLSATLDLYEDTVVSPSADSMGVGTAFAAGFGAALVAVASVVGVVAALKRSATRSLAIEEGASEGLVA